MDYRIHVDEVPTDKYVVNADDFREALSMAKRAVLDSRNENSEVMIWGVERLKVPPMFSNCVMDQSTLSSMGLGEENMVQQPIHTEGHLADNYTDGDDDSQKEYAASLRNCD